LTADGFHNLQRSGVELLRDVLVVVVRARCAQNNFKPTTSAGCMQRSIWNAAGVVLVSTRTCSRLPCAGSNTVRA
jgi:hypothetical protein